MNDEIIETIKYDMRRAEINAWKALAGYKFWMFGYHAACWVNLNKLLSKKKANPFGDAVDLARTKLPVKKGTQNYPWTGHRKF